VIQRAVRSMTGYGRGVAEHAGVRATIDLRAVNHRFLDIKLRGTGVSAAIEEALTTKIRGALERGAVAVSVHVQHDLRVSGSRIDHDAATRAGEMLVQLATTLGLAKPDLALVLAQPGETVEAAVDNGDDSTAVIKALESALAQLEVMRTNEGKALATELNLRLDELTTLRGTISTLAANVPQLVSKRLHERVKRLLETTDVDPSRLAQEVALLADRADVTEELVRLASHIEQARALIASPTAAGRRLDFLVQEIGRELNTIGSKSTVAEISTTVVDAKAVLEKVREQVQNDE
jgi:uncharacterized protein (TIGR00255 family)